MSRWPGRLISKTPVTPSGPGPTASAPGIWSLPEVAYWTKQGRWPSASADPYWSYVSYLLGTTATNGAQNNTFLDSSTNNFTITRNGNATQGSFTPYGTLWSNYFDGSGDYLSISNNAAFQFGTGDFTVECWVNKPAAANGSIVDVRSGGTGAVPWAFYVDGSNFPYFYDGTSYTSSVAITNNQWNHIAVVRTSGVLKIFVNGVQGYSAAYTASLDATGSLLIGGTAAYTTGYISNLRIVKGTAVYTAAFTPPAAPLTAISGTSLLTCQSNRFRDASGNNFAITKFGDTRVAPFSPFILPPPGYDTPSNGGSGYFDGSGDYLTSATGTAFGTGDFTVEGWFYALASSGTRIIYDGRPSSTNGAYQTIYVDLNGYLSLYSNSADRIKGTVAVTLNQWNHFALSRSGTSTRLFLNGVQQGSTYSDSTNYLMGTSRPAIATDGSSLNVNNFVGYLANIRSVAGTAVYTSAFTPPTTPVTAISGTSLLLNFTNAGIFDASMNNNMETVGNAQVSTGQAKFGTTSAYFDGSGDVLLSPAGLPFNFGTGDFTVEFWMYKTSSTAYQRMVAYGGFTAAGNFQIEATDDTTLTVHINGGYVSTTVPSLLNNWVHVAVTRQSGSVRVFTNGTLRSTNTQAGSVSQTNAFSVGAVYDASSPYTGYIDDLRVTNGYARYTATFTAPTAALPVY